MILVTGIIDELLCLANPIFLILSQVDFTPILGKRIGI
jgi:hypothetical protein